jgi:hypothetical protein
MQRISPCQSSVNENDKAISYKALAISHQLSAGDRRYAKKKRPKGRFAIVELSSYYPLLARDSNPVGRKLKADC